MNIALIYGGRSGEHEVSINSARGVLPHLCKLGHTVYLLAITLEGRWFYQNKQEREKPLGTESKKEGGKEVPIGTTIKTDHPLTIVPGEGVFCGEEKLPLDAAFAVTHGFGGEDGNLQGLCMLANLPLCGCDTLSSAIGMHKDIAAKLFALEDIPTVPSQALRSQDILWLEGGASPAPSWLGLQGDQNSEDKTGTNSATKTQTEEKTLPQTPIIPPMDSIGKMRWEEVCVFLQEKVGLSLFVKPEDSGSSLGVSALRTPTAQAFREAVLQARKHSASVLVQALIEPMDELECAVLETEEGTILTAGPALVVDPGKRSNHFLSYAYKYSQVDTAYLQLPSSYAEPIEKQIRLYAKKAFKAIGGEGYARVDFFVSRDAIYLNEINTAPGMTDKSHFPTLMAHAGYSMEQVLHILIEGALKRKREEKLRTYRPPEA